MGEVLTKHSLSLFEVELLARRKRTALQYVAPAVAAAPIPRRNRSPVYVINTISVLSLSADHIPKVVFELLGRIFSHAQPILLILMLQAEEGECFNGLAPDCVTKEGSRFLDFS